MTTAPIVRSTSSSATPRTSATADPVAARARPRPPAHRVRARHGGVRAGGGRPLRRRRSTPGSPPSTPTPTTCGPSTPSSTPTRCRAGSTRASPSCARDGTRWGAGNLFTVHNWWHLALYELEAGRPERALAIYDAEIHHAGSLGVPIEMLDASALLWRLLLDGVDTGGRFGPLADAWAPKADGRAVVRVQRPARRDGVRRRRPARPTPRELIARLDGWLDGGVGLERRDDGRDRPAGVPRRHRLRRGSPRRRHRRADPDPPLLPALRWLARPARRAAAHAAGVGAARRAVRAGHARSPPSGSACARRACTAGPSGRGPCGASPTSRARRPPRRPPRPIVSGSGSRAGRRHGRLRHPDHPDRTVARRRPRCCRTSRTTVTPACTTATRRRRSGWPARRSRGRPTSASSTRSPSRCGASAWFERGCISSHFRTMVVEGEEVQASTTTTGADVGDDRGAQGRRHAGAGGHGLDRARPPRDRARGPPGGAGRARASCSSSTSSRSACALDDDDHRRSIPTTRATARRTRSRSPRRSAKITEPHPWYTPDGACDVAVGPGRSCRSR